MIRKPDSIVPSLLIKQDQNNGLSKEIDVKISINGNSQSNNVLISKQKLKWQTNLSLKKQLKQLPKKKYSISKFKKIWFGNFDEQ